MEVEVSLKFLESAVDVKPNFGDDRVADLTGKPEFADIADHEIILADGTAINTALRQAIIDADGGTKAQKDALLGLEKKWDKYWKKAANYVTEKARQKDDITDQVNIVNVSGFDYNKIARTKGVPPEMPKSFVVQPIPNEDGHVVVNSESLGNSVVYITIFSTDAAWLDLVKYENNQITFPPTTVPFIIHHTTDARSKKVTLTSGVKWYGVRFGINNKGKGPNSNKASVIPQ